MKLLKFEEIKNQDIDILLVDDNPNDAELTLRALKKTNLKFIVYWVKDGEEALHFISYQGKYEDRSGQVKLIILDLKLPKLNGLEVLEEIRKSKEAKIKPVIILSSSREEIDIETSYKLGANSYVVKPVDFEKYMNTIKDMGVYWLSHNQYSELS